MQHVIACYTPFHVMMAEAIIEDLRALGADPGDCTLVLPRPEDLGDYRPEPPTRFRLLEAPPASSGKGSRFQRFLSRRQEARRSRILLFDIARHLRSQEAVFYYPHLGEYLTNSVVLGRALAAIARCEVIPDGLLNFYSHKVGLRWLPTQVARWLSGRTAGLPYQFFRGELTGIDRRGVRQEWSLAPQLAVRPDKATLIRNAREAIVGNGVGPIGTRDNSLILGQEDYVRIMGPAKYWQFWGEFAGVVKAELADDATLFYKPHPLAGAEVVKRSMEMLGSVNCLRTHKPAELLLDSLAVGRVVSIASSTLMHVRILRLDGMDAVSVGGRRAAELTGTEDHWKEIEKLFRTNGVRMVTI